MIARHRSATVETSSYRLVRCGRPSEWDFGRKSHDSGVTVEEALQRLPDLLGAVEAGDLVEVRAESGRSYRLAPNRPRPPVTGVPKAGRLKGLLVVPDDFDEPLEELREYMQ
jgi:antitoxin (DNA-binding transcriptional repressor) of toxin-antitoxin stability system